MARKTGCISFKPNRKKLIDRNLDTNRYRVKVYFNKDGSPNQKDSKQDNSSVWKLTPKVRESRVPKRSRYFTYYRRERNLLKTLENTFPSSYNHNEYRACRYLYRYVIPYLARHLWHPPDWERLWDEEIKFYNVLLSFAYRRKAVKKEPDRIPIWRFRQSM